MSRTMLIDAAHPEETRVVIVDNNRVEEFDYESASRKPIRGNIYLAKVTRVEPSLQAAFVEYGGNKHGFLAFNEIHPDYYQIPHADRMALREQEEQLVGDIPDDAGEDDGDIPDEDDLIDEAARQRRNFLRKYKIQEVIKRRQVLLVQVAKEERGNKGAALTTYLSLAGRYCVLMPNTARGGGISRKITNVADRKRLKSAVSELKVPGGMGLIIRTAGASRTKAEIKRDYDYLIRLWENIRETTLKSTAPSLIYEEGNLVKRTIRDLYDKDIDEVLVEGDEAYKEAKAFMRMLMPSHARKVQHYKDDAPLFLRHQVESQLEAIHSPSAQLKSGGYIVLNPTEALVAIDVNSGKSTKERGIEQTALRTNLEAAEEAARQMRLRDLAGLLVIDFIDMDESKNVRAVEKKMKDALKKDRARIQVGRISQFGLLEMSRQRRRTSLVEGSTDICPLCQGTGYVRSIESSALVALRTLEEEGVRGRTAHARLSCPSEVTLYLLNEKRDHLNAIEQRYGMRVTVLADDTLNRPSCTLEKLESRRESEHGGHESILNRPAVIATDIEDSADAFEDEAPDDEETAEEPPAQKEPARPVSDAETDEEGGKKRRRRGRRGGRNRRKRGDERPSSDAGQPGQDANDQNRTGEEAEAQTSDALTVIEPESTEAFSSGETPPKRARPSRRRKKSEAQAGAVTDTPADDPEASSTPGAETAEQSEEPAKKPRRRTRKAASADGKPAEETAAAAPAESAEPSEEKPKPKRRTRRKKAEAEETPEAVEAAPEKQDAEPARTPAEDSSQASDGGETGKPGDAAPRKRGWWQRSGKILGLG